MKNLLLVGGCWGYVNCTEIRPSNPRIDGFDKEIAKWEMENAHVVTWFAQLFGTKYWLEFFQM